MEPQRRFRVANKRRKSKKNKKLSTFDWIKRVFVAALSLGSLGFAVLVGMFVYFSFGLPSIENLNDYAPIQVSKVYSDDGYLVGQFADERRTVVPINEVPEHVLHAFLAAEDDGFYNHEGIDYMGVMRAAIKNLRPGAHLQGASTITQQTVKTLVVGDERSYARKMREALLTRKLEQMLGKNEILHLYISQIYFGSGNYGVEEASLDYFGKSVRKLSLGEAAYLAGIPKNPGRYTLRANPKAAKQRQTYVLKRMLENGWSTPEETQKAIEARVPQIENNRPYLGKTPHYVEYIRRKLIKEYGEEMLMTGGMKIYTGMDAKAQIGGQRALQQGLEELAMRQGYSGPKLRIEADSFKEIMSLLGEIFDKGIEKRNAFNKAGTALSTTRDSYVWDLALIREIHLASTSRLIEAMQIRKLQTDGRYFGVVTIVDSPGKAAYVDLGSAYAKIPLKNVYWARKFSPTRSTKQPNDPTQIFRVGDIVGVDLVSNAKGKRAGKRWFEANLVPVPKAEGALVAIDQHTRYVRAMVGGYEQRPGGLIRAVQSKRQPGSCFKPVVYATAIAEKAITPASICPDSPVTVHDQWTGKPWRPENFDHKYDGNITFRMALTKSKNTCSVKLLEKIGPEVVIDMAHRMGIDSNLPKNLTLALGTGEVTPIQLANAYAVISSGGLFAEPIFVRKIIDRKGKVIFRNEELTEEVLDPAAAYVTAHMMQGVVEEGTATRAKVLDRPLAGKTGTTQESRSVWFSGFSAELTATVYVGFDDNSKLGRAYGSNTALPIWIRFMGRALADTPVAEFPEPEGVVRVWVNKKTGLAAEPPPDPENPAPLIEEAFIEGTEPQIETQPLTNPFLIDGM